MDKKNLVKKFEDAGLMLELSNQPIAGGKANTGVVQMDIRRRTHGSRREEWFILYPGDQDGTVIEVLNADKDLAQLLLMVKEPKTTFEITISKANYDASQRDGARRKPKLLRRTKTGMCVIEQSTDAQTHFYLMGVDERQLFMAEVRPPVTTVKNAHDRLRATTITTADIKKGEAIRQGEWFFVKATADENRAITESIRGVRKANLGEKYWAQAAVKTKTSIGEAMKVAQGNPHTCDEIIEIVQTEANKMTLGHGWPIRSRGEIFVRGAVRHKDHKTIVLAGWHKVIRNQEVSTQRQRLGMSWID